MKTLLPLLITLLIPSLAWAHPGHGSYGLFHHLSDVAPLILLVVFIAAGTFWARSRK